ncbi:MAG: type II toxin-antitoxin system RelE/ParE family toxin [Fretibacterium sp.]|nr:type II toxin-antitoxin system RelE/ParE family toxin [Fretibacterium sp.]
MPQQVQILMMPAFKRSYKKLHANQKSAANKAIEVIRDTPEIGVPKRGDLSGVFVHKFNCIGQEMLLAYEYDPLMRLLLALGVQENFYRDLKK